MCIFCLGQQKSQISKIHIFAKGKFIIHYVILNSALWTRIEFFKTAQCRNAEFLIQSKGIPITDIYASILLRYSFWLNYECTIRERNATIALDLKIEINATQDLKWANSHRKIENSENRDCCEFPAMLRSEYHHWYLLHTHTKFQHLATVLPRDMEWTIFSSVTYARTHVPTYEHHPSWA